MANVNKKKKSILSLVLLTMLLVIIAAAALIWIFFYKNKSYISDAKANINGTIETGAGALETSLREFDMAEPAGIISDRAKVKDRVALIFVGLTEETDDNIAVLKALSDNGLKASFALSAAEVLENDDELAEIMAQDCEIVSNGAAAESNIHSMSKEDMLKSMIESNDKISRAIDKNIDIIYCSSTRPTADVLRAAAVGGYSAVIDPDIQNIIDENSFTSETDVSGFIDSLHGDSIVIVNLRGKAQGIQDEEQVVMEKPAVDIQAGINDTKQPKEEPIPVRTQAEWIIKALAQKRDTLETEYIGSFELTDGMTALRTMAEADDAEQAPIYRYCLIDEDEIGLGFTGVPESTKLLSMLSEFETLGLKATFFVSADEAEVRADELAKMTESACNIGAYIPSEELNGQSGSAVFDSMYETVKSLESIQGYMPVFYADSSYNEESLRAVSIAAKLLGVRIAGAADKTELKPGSLRIYEDLEKFNAEELKAEADASGLEITDAADMVKASGKLKGLSGGQLTAIRKENNGSKAELISQVYTAEREAAFGFYGVSNANVTTDILGRLKAHNAKASFFVSLNELQNCGSVIENILDSGNDIGIYYRADSDYPQSFEAVASYINSWQKYAEWRYGTDSDVVFILGDVEEGTAEATSAMHCDIVKNTFLITRDEDKDITAEDIPTALGEIEKLRIMRGSFICFNMDFYSNDKAATASNTILGSLFDAFYERHIDSCAYRSHETGEIEDASRFTLTTVKEVLDAPDQYSFNEGGQTDVSIDKNVLTNMASDEERFEYMAERYYGNVTVDTKDKLPGFSSSEIKRLDKSGEFTDDKVIFLTFDDWGTEESINALLYVLEKHNVKASFFIKTEYMPSNPNSLRAIAVQGHQIASHTDGHIPLSNVDPTNENRAYTLTEEQAEAQRADIVLAYDKLWKYVGDVEVGGRKALTAMFRPPTLAVSKIGLSEVFDVGYTYSISGEYSTGDYEATSYEDMMNRFERRQVGWKKYVTIGNGSVVVMHMQENAKYTAEALDTMIPIWKSLGYSFARIDDYLN